MTYKPEEVEELVKAATRLSNEVTAIGAFETEVRQAISNTNWVCLRDRQDDLCAALAPFKPELVPVLPFSVEKWLITIKAHCTVLEDTDAELVKVLAGCIKIIVDSELRPAIIAMLAERNKP